LINPYEVLGVAESSNKEEVKKAYRKLALEHHPDRGGDENRFKEISEAYSILSDDNKRQQWFYEKANAQHQHDGLDLGDIFNQMFGGRQRRQQQQSVKPTTDSDIRFNLGVTLAQIKKGASQRIEFQRRVKCEGCRGTGGEGKENCSPCRGTGAETFMNHHVIQQTRCKHCHGAGHKFKKVCKKCRGEGIYRVRDSILVEIKKG
jgi:DnaJ-class molecular chaperone